MHKQGGRVPTAQLQKQTRGEGGCRGTHRQCGAQQAAEGKAGQCYACSFNKTYHQPGHPTAAASGPRERLQRQCVCLQQARPTIRAARLAQVASRKALAAG